MKFKRAKKDEIVLIKFPKNTPKEIQQKFVEAMNRSMNSNDMIILTGNINLQVVKCKKKQVKIC